MATATSSRRLVLALALVGAVALLVAGCGGASGGGRTTTAQSHAAAGPFAWLRASSPPPGWTIARLPSGKAAMAYPPGWRAIKTDPGTVSAALMGPHGRIRGYLNATPRSGAETLANWATFRVAHNREEGDRAVVRESTASGVHFRSGVGSCVTDRYATTTGAHYREIACIVRGARGTTVIVAAAPPSDWSRIAPQLQRSVASFA